MRFSYKFFERPAEVVAKELLGAELHRIIDGRELIGRIVETEAYDQAEPSCHAYRGRTPRTLPLFGHPGFSYVYFTYGMHYCLNVVTDEYDHGAAVLLRALEPVRGQDIMYVRRPKAIHERDLLSGPAKLTQAMDIDLIQNGIDLVQGETMYLTKGKLRKDETVDCSTRIGIKQARDFPWRFFISGSEFVSKGKPS